MKPLRRSSAGSIRHHRAYLPYRITNEVPAAVTVTVEPEPEADTAHQVHAYDKTGRELSLRDDTAMRILALLQGAYPRHPWDLPLTWQKTANHLTADDGRRAAA